MRRLLAGLLMLLAAVLAAVALTCTWAYRQGTDTDAFMAAAAPLATDATVQGAVARELVDRTLAQLPAAAPAPDAVRARLVGLADGLTTAPGYRAAWRSTQRTVHARLANRMTGASEEPLTLPLDRVAAVLRARATAAGLGELATGLGDPAPVVIADRAEVRDARRAADAVHTLRTVGILGAVLALFGVLATAPSAASGLLRAGGCLIVGAALTVGAWAAGHVAATDVAGAIGGAVYDPVAEPLWRWALGLLAAGLLAAAGGLALRARRRPVRAR